MDGRCHCFSTMLLTWGCAAKSVTCSHSDSRRKTLPNKALDKFISRHSLFAEPKEHHGLCMWHMHRHTWCIRGSITITSRCFEGTRTRESGEKSSLKQTGPFPDVRRGTPRLYFEPVIVQLRKPLPTSYKSCVTLHHSLCEKNHP